MSTDYVTRSLPASCVLVVMYLVKNIYLTIAHFK